VTTIFFLVRHAAHDSVGDILCGRTRGVTLGAIGRAQAQRLSGRFRVEKVACVLTGPLERARETAEAIGLCTGQPPQICDGLDEIDFGMWAGMSFATLAQDPRWTSWNTARGVSRAPGGETMLEAQTRIVAAMERLRNTYSDKSVVLVSHADVIKAALLYHLGMPVDAYSRFDIEPASVSTLVVGDWGSRVLRLNEAVPA
jgi:broad specificity phosphatase PhoE